MYRCESRLTGSGDVKHGQFTRTGDGVSIAGLFFVGHGDVNREARFVARENLACGGVDEVNQRSIPLSSKRDVTNIFDIDCFGIFLGQRFAIRQFRPGIMYLFKVKLELNRVFPVHQPGNHTGSVVFGKFLFPCRHRCVFTTVENGLCEHLVVFLLERFGAQVGSDTTLVDRAVTTLTLFFKDFGEIHAGCSRHCHRGCEAAYGYEAHQFTKFHFFSFC